MIKIYLVVLEVPRGQVVLAVRDLLVHQLVLVVRRVLEGLVVPLALVDFSHSCLGLLVVQVLLDFLGVLKINR